MHPVSQVIERNLHRRAPVGGALWLNMPRDDLWRRATSACPALSLACQDHGVYRFFEASGANAEFGAFPQRPPDPYPWVVLRMPRQRALLDMLLGCAASLLAGDGVLWLAGENKAGAKSAGKVLKRHFDRVTKLDSARHCTLYEAARPNTDAPFDAVNHRQAWPLELSGVKLTVLSYPGVFAHGRLDDGTALLLDAISGIDLSGRVLDFACGAGVIGAFVAATCPGARVDLLDNSALALRSTRETLEANGLEGRVFASDGFSDVTDRYDLVVSNPPFHEDVKADRSMAVRLLEPAARHLVPGGRLVLVANRHLPYEKALTGLFGACECLAENSQFKVLAATA